MIDYLSLGYEAIIFYQRVCFVLNASACRNICQASPSQQRDSCSSPCRPQPPTKRLWSACFRLSRERCWSSDSFRAILSCNQPVHACHWACMSLSMRIIEHACHWACVSLRCEMWSVIDEWKDACSHGRQHLQTFNRTAVPVLLLQALFWRVSQREFERIKRPVHCSLHRLKRWHFCFT